LFAALASWVPHKRHGHARKQHKPHNARMPPPRGGLGAVVAGALFGAGEGLGDAAEEQAGTDGRVTADEGPGTAMHETTPCNMATDGSTTAGPDGGKCGDNHTADSLLDVGYFGKAAFWPLNGPAPAPDFY
jgi:hypothetical protein